MFSLLRSEWYQVKKMNSVKITSAILLVVSVLYSVKILEPEQMEYLQANDRIYELYVGGGLCESMKDGAACLLIAGLFAGFLISAGFENRTIQTAVSCGKSRTKVYVAKMCSYLSVVTILSVIYWLGSNVGAFIRYGLGTAETVGNLSRTKYILGMLVAGTIAYISVFSICGVIAFFSRRVGVTMGICFVGILLGGNMLAVLLPEKVIKWIKLTPLGLYNQVLKLNVSMEDIWKTGLAGFLWTVLICGIGLWKFKRTGLK